MPASTVSVAGGGLGRRVVLEAGTVVGHIRSSKMRENSSDGTSCGGLSQKHVGNEAKWHAQKARKMAEAAQVDGAQMLRWLGPQVGVIVDVCDEFRVCKCIR